MCVGPWFIVGNCVTNQVNIQFLQQKEMISLAVPLSSPQETVYSLQQLWFIALCLYSSRIFSVTVK